MFSSPSSHTCALGIERMKTPTTSQRYISLWWKQFTAGWRLPPQAKDITVFGENNSLQDEDSNIFGMQLPPLAKDITSEKPGCFQRLEIHYPHLWTTQEHTL
jgi:ATP-dependent exoDNAse (exonuclease V) alpha subunit